MYEGTLVRTKVPSFVPSYSCIRHLTSDEYTKVAEYWKKNCSKLRRPIVHTTSNPNKIGCSLYQNNTKVPSYQNCSVLKLIEGRSGGEELYDRLEHWNYHGWSESVMEKVEDIMEGNFLSRYNNKLTGRRV